MVDLPSKTCKTQRFPIGKEDYKRVVDEGFVFIDKTLLIKEFWEDMGEITLVTRPRRFGKSIALSMMRYFFEKTAKPTAYLFENSKIWQEEEFRKIQGTYPVIHISFKDVKSRTWDEAYQKIQSVIAQEIRRTLKPIESMMSKDYKKNYEALMDETASKTKFAESLFFITEVFKEYLGENTIVLIDEYDAPIINSYMHGYYDEMIEFMRDLFAKALKGNIHLRKGFMTGVVRTAKDGILSGLNNPKICTMLDSEYSDKFGFTEDEVKALLCGVNRSEKETEVKKWYNGYIVGTKNANLAHSIYNPWSILNYLDNTADHPQSYWVSTGSTDLLERLIAEAGGNTQEELKLLLEGKALERKIINEDVILLDLDEKECEPWSFLFFAGYLTATGYTFDNKYYYTLELPDKEIADLYKDLVVKAIDKKLKSAQLVDFLKALVAGNSFKVESLLRNFIQSFCSSHDLPHNDLERSLHLFVLGLLVSLSERYIVDSNIESGKGRYDIMLCPRSSLDPGILLEFKKGENLEKLSLDALEQIKAQNYKARLKNLGYLGPVLAYGIATYKKELLVKMELLPFKAGN